MNMIFKTIVYTTMPTTMITIHKSNLKIDMTTKFGIQL